jgi:hypothetical protein
MFSREAVIDRRQPQIRWTAVLAGALLAIGLWNLLQLLLVGGALSAIDPDEVDDVRLFGIGTGIGSMLAPLIAMFVGGLLAGRMASHYDRRVSGLHGVLVWALTSVVGLVLMATVLGALADKSTLAHGDAMPPVAGTRAYLDDQVTRINRHLEAQHAPTITTDDVVDAARVAGTTAGGTPRTLDRSAFIARLDAETKLSRPEAEAAIGELGDDAPDVIAAGHQLAVHRQYALAKAEDTGCALLVAGIGLLLCGATAIAGAIFGARRGNRRYARPDTIPGHTTAPYPTPPAPDLDADLRRDPME